MMSTLLVEIPFQVRLTKTSCMPIRKAARMTVVSLPFACTSTPEKSTLEIITVFFQILCCLVYIFPSYVLTNQPLELIRFSYFVIFLVVTSLTSQSTGFFCGATLPVKVNRPLVIYFKINLVSIKMTPLTHAYERGQIPLR